MPIILRQTKNQEHALPVLLIIFIALVISAPYYTVTIPYIQNQDLSYHLIRIRSIADGILDGNIPVRLYDGFCYGFGDPTGICYPDLFLYLPALLCVLGLHVKTAYTTFVFLINVATGLASYFSFNPVFGSRENGLACSVLWILSPYRLCNVLTRAALAEYLAMAFIPIIVYGFWRIFICEKDLGCSWIVLSLGFAGVIFSHILTATVVIILSVIVAIPLFVTSEKPLRAVLTALIKAAVLALGLTAGFAVPFIDYYSTHRMRIHSGFNNLLNHALEPAQILSPITRFTGYSSKLGSDLSAEMPLEIGWSILLVLFFVFASLVKPSICVSIKRKNRFLMSVGLILVLILLFMTTCLFPWNLQGGSFIARVVQRLTTIQFPWRLLGPATAICVLLFGSLLVAMRDEFRKALLLCVLLVVVEAGYAISSFNLEAQRISESEALEKTMAGATFYLPEGINSQFIEEWDGDEPVPLEQNIVVEEWRRLDAQASLITVRNNTPNEGNIRLPLFWHRYYRAFDTSGRPYSELNMLSNDNGYVFLTVPAQYSGSIYIRFVEPPLWRVAETISLLFAALIVFMSVGRKHTHRKTVDDA